MINYYKIDDNKDQRIELTGNGKKGLLIVVEKEGSSEELLAKLDDIVKAIKYDPREDTFVVVLAKSVVNQVVSKILKEHKINDILAFGIEAKDIFPNAESYLYYPLKSERIRMLISDNLSKIFSDKALKMKLWKCLQQMYLHGNN